MAHTITKLSIAAGSALFATMAAGLAPAQAVLLNFAVSTNNTTINPVNFQLDTSVPNTGSGGTNTFIGAIKNLKFDSQAVIPTANLTTSGTPAITPALLGNFTYNISTGTGPQLTLNFDSVGVGVDLTNIGSLTSAASFDGARVVQAISFAPGGSIISPNVCNVVIGTTLLPTLGTSICAGIPAPPPNGGGSITVPESNPTTSLLALSALGASATLLRKMKHKASLTTV